MKTRIGVAVLLVGAAIAASACTRTDDGVPTAGSETSSPSTSETTTTAATTSETVSPFPSDGPDEPGVMPTPAPADATCAPTALPPVTTVARVSDPAAPTVTIGVPEGWLVSPRGDDPEAGRLQGPDGMTAVVTIAPTALDAAAAFRQFADDLTAQTDISTVSLLPGELCEYSGQELMGILKGSAPDAQSVQYQARIVHVSTSGQGYLIAVYVEAPSEAPGFDDPASVVTGDFEIGLP